MTRRDEMLAVISERDNEIVRHIVLHDRFFSPLWWYHRREIRRLRLLNERDLERLPPQRYRQPKHTGPANVVAPRPPDGV